MSDETTYNSAALVVSDPDHSYRSQVQKDNAKLAQIEHMDQSFKFIKTGLGLTDKELEKIKIKDIQKKIQEANEKITVKGMKELMGGERKKIGFIRRLLGVFSSGNSR